HQEQSYSLLNRIRVLEDEIKELVQYKSNHEEQQVNFESQLNDKTCQAQAFEEKFVKLKEIYAKLREEHVVLLRNYGNVQQTLQQETEKNKDLEKALEDLRNQEKSSSIENAESLVLSEQKYTSSVDQLQLELNSIIVEKDHLIQE
uniref:Uncharacterized protein n=1 Tax=Trichobilharzia regenti TaxID=157069 RepID=A0AA85J3S5_TRIRE